MCESFTKVRGCIEHDLILAAGKVLVVFFIIFSVLGGGGGDRRMVTSMMVASVKQMKLSATHNLLQSCITYFSRNAIISLKIHNI